MPEAVVIGAGIGGLSAAIALHAAGYRVTIAEQAAAIREIGAGISLWANAIRALDRLGVGAAVRAASVSYASAGLRTADGATLASIDTDELRRVLDVPVVVMHRADLLGALTRQAAGIDLQFGRRCVGVRQESGRAVAEFEDGRPLESDLLIGADGLHSVVRAAVHGPTRLRYAGCAAWRSVVPFDGQLRAGETWGHGSVFGMVPMAGGRVYWYATENVPAAEPRSADEKSRLLARFRGWHAPVESLIAAASEDQILRNDLYDRPPLSRWSRGLVTLLGDAAHPMLPYLGQGGCQAIEDAVALGEAVRVASNVSSALDAYQRARVRRANKFVAWSHLAGRMAQLEQPMAVRLRNAIVRRASPRMQARRIARLIAS